MKTTTRGLALLGFAVLGSPAYADVSSTITLSTDYDFRGITQTAGDPALSASLDWSTEPGLYVGAWASNVDWGPGADADVEIDLYGGFRGSISEDFGFDVGAVYYLYEPGGDDSDFAEVYGSLTYKIVSAKLWYAWDFNNTGDSATYLEANAAIPLPQEFSLGLHAGYSDGDFWDAGPDGSYIDWSIGVSRSFGNFALSLKYIDGSDLKSSDGTPGDVFSSESKVYFSVATTLPWGK